MRARARARPAEPFDWYQRYDAMRELLRAVVPPTASVLVAGCGNSRLTSEMWRDGECAERGGRGREEQRRR